MIRLLSLLLLITAAVAKSPDYNGEGPKCSTRWGNKKRAVVTRVTSTITATAPAVTLTASSTSTITQTITLDPFINTLSITSTIQTTVSISSSMPSTLTFTETESSTQTSTIIVPTSTGFRGIVDTQNGFPRVRRRYVQARARAQAQQDDLAERDVQQAADGLKALPRKIYNIADYPAHWKAQLALRAWGSSDSTTTKYPQGVKCWCSSLLCISFYEKDSLKVTGVVTISSTQTIRLAPATVTTTVSATATSTLGITPTPIQVTVTVLNTCKPQSELQHA